MAAFSLQQGKHITTGEGGIATSDDPAVARKLFLCVNKAWGYGDASPDHYFPALNYRMTELQGAVANAQLQKLDSVVSQRRAAAAGLRQRLAQLPGIALPNDPDGGTHAYWKFAFTVTGGVGELGDRIRHAGVACAPRYIQKPAFECALFQDWSKSPVTAMPLQNNPRNSGPMPPFVREQYPGAVRGLDEILVLPVNENYRDDHLDHIALVIKSSVEALGHG
jgi:dTDP-4-amino-4,6-dideoxygalactose transaminase